MKLTQLRRALGRQLPARLAPLPVNPDATPRLYGRANTDRRARYLRLRPLCVECQASGVTVPIPLATELDHVIPLELGGAESDANLQGLCSAHHAEKTRREAIDRARRQVGAG